MALRQPLKRARWNKAYLETGNMSEASRIAGYKVGSRGGKTDKISEVKTMSAIGRVNLDKMRDDIEYWKKIGSEGVNPDEIVGILLDIARNKSEKSNNRMTASELLGKTKAMFTDKSETVNRTMQITQDITAPFNENSQPDTQKAERLSPPDAI